MNTLTEARKARGITHFHIRNVMKDWTGSRYTINTSGENGQVAMVTNVREPYSIKRVYKPEVGLASREAIAGYEVGILDLLTDHIDTAPVAIPTVIDQDYPDGLFVVQYIPGLTLTEMQVGRMTIPEKENLGKKLAQFVVWFSKTIPIDDPRFRKLYGENPITYDKRSVIINTTNTTSRTLDSIGQHELAAVTSDLLEERDSLIREGLIKERDIVGHDDLKTSNLVFDYDSDGSLALKGVIDFGATKATTAEQELKRTVLMGDTVLHSALEEYERITGISLNERLVRFWDKVHFVIWATNLAFGGQTGRDRLQFLITQLQRIYPNFDARELTGEIKYHYSK